MRITPLQRLLLYKTEPSARVAQVTGLERTQIWKWKLGLAFPNRLNALKLIELFGRDRLDFNGCYEASHEISEDDARALGLLNHKSETQ
jgi:hypothetical protein